MHREELLVNLDRAREKLMRAIEGLTEGEMTQERVNREWTVKDILGHITSCEGEDRRVAQRIAIEANPKFDYEISPENDWRDWNVQQVEIKRNFSLERVLDELREEHLKFIDFVNSLTDEQLDRKEICPWKMESTVEELIRVSFKHEEEHAEKILNWRQRIKV